MKTKLPSKNPNPFVFFLFYLVSLSMHSQTNTYTGVTGGNWGTASNWSLALVPTAAHDVVVPDNKDIIVNVAVANCSTLTINTGANNNNVNVGANTLTISGALTINFPTVNNKNKIVSVSSGTLNCGSIVLANSGTGTRDCRVIATSGVINVLGDITMGGNANENQIILDGTTTGGTLNLGGNFTTTQGDLVPGNYSTVNYNGTVAQTLTINGNFVYNDILINNTNAAGVTIQANITTAKVLGNINVQTGILNSGGRTIAGNTGKSFTVANGATFNTSSNGANAFPSGFTTYNIGATSTVEYSRAGNQTVYDIASPGYGNLVFSGSGNRTPGSGIDVQGNVTVNTGVTLVLGTLSHGFSGNLLNDGTVTLTSAGGLNLSGNMTNNGTLTSGATSTINVGGNWANNGTFTGSTSGTVVFTSTTTGKTLTGTLTGTTGKFTNLTFNGAGGAWTIATNVDVAKVLAVTDGNVSMSGIMTVAGSSAITIGSSAVFTLQNNASLLQTGYTGANSGNINVIRNTTPIIKFDYTYWSSPTNGTQTLYDFSPGTLGDKFLTYNNAWILETSSNTFLKGIGFAIRAPQSTDPVVPTVTPFMFTGVPNNGTVAIPVTAGSRLLGNPYPSTLDANAFIDANVTGSGTINQTISGTLSFWTHNHTLSGNNYSSSDYATYTKLGGTGVATGTGNLTTPTRYITSGQGFFVVPVAAGNVTFNNSMRLGTNNTNFYKTANNTTAADSEENLHRIWLNLTNPSINFSQSLIGYMAGATNGYDPGYDGLFVGTEQFVLYSILDSNMFTIQARAVPFVDTDTVPLGYKVNEAGPTTISIDHVDGIFLADQDIYLQDLLLNVIHNIKESPYTFESEAGTFNERFVLRYTDGSLATNGFENNSNAVQIASNKHYLKVKSASERISKIVVYDMLGRVIFEKKELNTTEFATTAIAFNQQTLIVKVTLANNETITKKVIH